MKGLKESRILKTAVNRDVIVFAFFLLLSFIFWYLNSLDKVVEANIRYQVRYTNVPRGRVVTENQPARVNLYLKGPGSSILRQKLSGKKMPLTIDISKVSYKRVAGSKEPDYYLITSGLSRSFTVQLRSEFEITSIKPDTLFFTLSKATEDNQSQQRRSIFGRRKKTEDGG